MSISSCCLRAVHWEGPGYVSSRSYRQPKICFCHAAFAVILLVVFGIAPPGLFDEHLASSTVFTNIAGINKETKRAHAHQWRMVKRNRCDWPRKSVSFLRIQQKIASAELARGSPDDAKKRRLGAQMTLRKMVESEVAGDSEDYAKGGSINRHCKKELHMVKKANRSLSYLYQRHNSFYLKAEPMQQFGKNVGLGIVAPKIGPRSTRNIRDIFHHSAGLKDLM
jgi:hypothetical protein